VSVDNKLRVDNSGDGGKRKPARVDRFSGTPSGYCPVQGFGLYGSPSNLLVRLPPDDSPGPRKNHLVIRVTFGCGCARDARQFSPLLENVVAIPGTKRRSQQGRHAAVEALDLLTKERGLRYRSPMR
jgi:hypothetical protein